MKTIRLLLLFILLALFILAPLHRAAAQTGTVIVMNLNGVISPATDEYLKRGITIAGQEGAQLVIIQLDTPGGDIESMKDMAARIRASTVPVVVYVSPSGAMAASAGSIITMSAHAAAMAPQTIIGAASPVGSNGTDLGVTEQAKVTNAMVAIVTGYTEQRGPQAVQLAADMIQNAKAVPAEEALKAKLIDFIAPDLPTLLKDLDGFKVQLADGPHVLHTAGLVQQPLNISFIEQLLQYLIDPNIVFLLLAIGVQAILIELTHPGAWVPAFFGVVCLSLAAYGLGVLPVNWFGIIFIITAFVLFIIEIKTPTHGAMMVAGVVSFIIGALVLFNSPGTPRFQRVSLPLVIFAGVFIGSIFAVILGFALRAQRSPILMGMQTYMGHTGIATMDINPTGQVQTGSELWTAELADGSEKIKQGDEVEVVSSEGLRLKVRKKT